MDTFEISKSSSRYVITFQASSTLNFRPEEKLLALLISESKHKIESFQLIQLLNQFTLYFNS